MRMLIYKFNDYIEPALLITVKRKANCQKNQFGSFSQFLIWGMPEKVGWGMPNRGMILDTHIISHVVERLRSLLYNIFITSIYIYNYVCHKLPYIVVALPKLYTLLPVCTCIREEIYHVECTTVL